MTALKFFLFLFGTIFSACTLVHHSSLAWDNIKNPKTAHIISVTFAGAISLWEDLYKFTLFGKIFICTIYQILCMPWSIISFILVAVRRLFVKEGY